MDHSPHEFQNANHSEFLDFPDDILKMLAHFTDNNLPNQATFKTLKLMYLKHVMKQLDLTYHDILNLQYKTIVHYRWFQLLYALLHGIRFSTEETKIVNKFFSRHYHDKENLILFADILNIYASRDDALAHVLNAIFAVDGFEKEYRHYVDNLQYDLVYPISHRPHQPIDYKELHVTAVRNIYDKLKGSVTPLQIRDAMLKLIENSTMQNDIIEAYMEVVGQDFNNNLIEVILERIKRDVNIDTHVHVYSHDEQ